MMKIVKVCSKCAMMIIMSCTVYSFAQAPKTVLNATQLGIDDLQLDLGLDFEDAAENATTPVSKDSVLEADSKDEPLVDGAVEEATDDFAWANDDSETNTKDTLVANAGDADVAFGDSTEVVSVGDTNSDSDDNTDVFAQTFNFNVSDDDDDVADTADAVELTPFVAETPVAAVSTPTSAASSLDASIDSIFATTPAVTATRSAQSSVKTDFAPAAVSEVTATTNVTVPAVAAATAAVVPDADIAESVSRLAKLEESRKRLFAQHGKDLLEQAKTQMSLGNFVPAAEKYKESLKYLSESDGLLRKEATDGLAESHYRNAMLLNKNGLNEEAKKSANEAMQFGHAKAPELLDKINMDILHPPKPEIKPQVKRTKQESYKDMRQNVKLGMRRANEYFATGEYDQCRKEVEFILRDYGWCEEAVVLLGKVNNRRYEYKLDEREAIRSGMIADVTRTWIANTYGVEFSGSEYIDNRGQKNEDTTKPGLLSEEAQVLNKLKQIILPEIDFRQANITDVVRFLSDMSREYDPTEDPEKRGVNIVLNLDADLEPAPAAAAGNPWETAPAPQSIGGIAPLTIAARNMALLPALDMIMEVAKLKYKIRGNVIMIMRMNAADSELLHRTYDVLPTINEKVTSINSDTGRGGGGGGFDVWGGGGAIGGGSIDQVQDWKEFFSQLGVQWPEGSTIQHMPTLGKLVVKNTSQNLATLEEVLNMMNVIPKQIEIEVRFVEVLQKDLESFGFEWNLRDDWEIAEMKADAGLPLASRRRLVMKQGEISAGFDFLSNNEFGKINNGMNLADNVFNFATVLTNPDLSLALHMLSSKKNTDLLSAPKVVAKNGTEATIKVVTEYIYPTTYTVQMLESVDQFGNRIYSGAVVEPGTFQMREVGVILRVTPDVSPDGSMINLALTPEVVSEPSWKNYGSRYPTAAGEYVMLPMEQPFFPVRSLATSIQIYNGATVVMGGMITEERYTSENKTPILGDIPLLGRLFRYKYEQSEKRNLLLFVTARLVDSSGREVRSSSPDLSMATAQ